MFLALDIVNLGFNSHRKYFLVGTELDFYTNPIFEKVSPDASHSPFLIFSLGNGEQVR